jgi:excisionase family DNA binding protein
MSSNQTYKKICENCGIEFEAKTLYTRYCTPLCNKRHYKKIKREETIQSVLNPQPTPQIKQPFDPTIQQKDFLNIDETATLIGASRRTIQRLITKGSLKVTKIGRRTIIKRTDIDTLFI